MLLRELTNNINHAAGGATAVLGWGRGMGHKGHMLLAQAVIHYAHKFKAEPYFVVSRTSVVDPSTGDVWTDRAKLNRTKDDPLTPNEKLAIYRKVFPDQSHIFSVATEDATKLEQVMAKLAQQGFTNIILVVGEDQKNALGYLHKADKSGTSPMQQIGLASLKIISRQDTKAPGSDVSKPDYQEGPRATPMRQVLLDPAKTEQDQFAVWRRDMPDNLGDEEVMHLMRTAKARLIKAHTPAVRGKKAVAEATGDERFDTMMGQIQREPTIPDAQMPPTDVKDLYQWAVKHHKPYHKIFAKWANREGYKSVAPALQKAGNLDSDALDYWTPDVWKLWFGPDSKMPHHWSKERVPDELRDYLETVFDAYENIWQDWPNEYRQIGDRGVAESIKGANQVARALKNKSILNELSEVPDEKMNPNAVDAGQGYTLFRDKGGIDRVYHLNRMMMAAAMADGKSKKPVNMPDSGWAQKYNIAFPFTDEEQMMVNQARATIPTDGGELEKRGKSAEPKDTNVISTVATPKRNKYGI
jgi:hypothetical protein